jgi:hypothetical protein
MYHDDDDETPHEPEPPSTADRWSALIFLLVILGLFAAEVFTNYSPIKLSALFLIGWWVPLLVLHEAGHALVAAALGWRVRQVVIGMGRVMASFRVGGVPVEIRLFPVQGFVIPAPRNLRSPHLKSALIYFAGPGAELLVLACVAMALGVDTLLTRTEHVGILAAQALAVAVLVSAFFNLVPHFAQSPAASFRRTGTSDDLIPNDGMGIILSFIRPTEHYAQQLDP